ncbi:MAG TPA: M20/M25/M40 family metallo-hydrolase [Vicinamibacterales bacterium]|nr:M20/M25/M40 family metallo-hydrolase [Vicinamibacterales bacterium]
MRRAPLCLVFAFAIAAAAQAPEPVDLAAIQKIRAEALERSQVMETLFWLTDRHGPRLTGSPGFEEAGDWAVTQLQEWGVRNVRRERFPFGQGWSLRRFSAQMIEPQVMPIIGMPKAWTPGTGGPVTADVVRVTLATTDDAAKLKGTLKGRIVLTQPARAVRMLDDRIVLRMNEKDIEEALSTPPPPAGRGQGPGRGQAQPGRLTASEITAFYKAEGVVATFDRGSDSDTSAGGSDLSWRTQRTDGGTVFVGGASRTEAADNTVPQVTLAVEHYNRMVRLLEHGVPVRVTLDIETAYHPEDPARPNGFNIVGEIPGTDKADEIVLIGAHFDSWHGATGATDNATGSAAMMEVLRILNATGLKPRRTIRMALWGAEENGLIGSRAYVETHLGTPAAPKPALAKHVAYFNIDNGTGKVRGVWLQGNPAVAPIFSRWIAPLKDLGVEILGPRPVTSTDHVSLDRVGVPAFQFVQERYEYNSRTHHSTMDVYDRVQAEDMKQVAAVVAVFAWQAATRDAPLPRK